MHAQLVAQGLLPAAANEASFKPTPRKYRNVPVVVDGERFDSKLEWRCREWLRCRCQAGDILWFTRQVPFRLEGGVIYRADFLAALKSGGVEVIDAKGRDTRASANKRKQVLARYGITVMLWPPKR
jgi:hypothetical protein